MSAMDDYLSGLPALERAALERVRALVRGMVAGVEEGTSYGVPAFLHAGGLSWDSPPRRNLSIFPFSAAALDAVWDRLAGFDLAKGTIRFSPDQPVPEEVLADIVRARRDELQAPASSER